MYTLGGPDFSDVTGGGSSTAGPGTLPTILQGAASREPALRPVSASSLAVLAALGVAIAFVVGGGRRSKGLW